MIQPRLVMLPYTAYNDYLHKFYYHFPNKPPIKISPKRP